MSSNTGYSTTVPRVTSRPTPRSDSYLSKGNSLAQIEKRLKRELQAVREAGWLPRTLAVT